MKKIMQLLEIKFPSLRLMEACINYCAMNNFIPCAVFRIISINDFMNLN